MVCLFALLLLPVFPAIGASRPATGERLAAAPQRLSDAEIQQKIHTKLAKSKIGKDGFTARVKGGVVTWEGRTAVPQHKGAATRMAKSSGAVRVVNNIQVNEGGKPGMPLHRAHIESE